MSAAEDSGAAGDGPRPPPSEPPGIVIAEAALPDDMDACFAIRRAVFCVEQGVSEDHEIDGRDPECRHYLLRTAGEAIGTARVRPVEPGVAKIERVAILRAYRGRGLGFALMRHVLRELGRDRAVLHAQTHSESFYRALGFAAEGAPFEEAGIPHVRMVRDTLPAGN